MVAKKTDWEIKEFKDTIRIDYTETFSNEKFQKIKNGFIPRQMEDKWFIYFHDGYLHFHRSWTGIAFCKVHFQKIETGAKITHILADSELAKLSNSETSYFINAVDQMVSNILLGKSKPYPKPKNSKKTNPSNLLIPVNVTRQEEQTAEAAQCDKKPWWRFW